jgi:hypothetical protein
MGRTWVGKSLPRQGSAMTVQQRSPTYTEFIGRQLLENIKAEEFWGLAA